MSSDSDPNSDSPSVPPSASAVRASPDSTAALPVGDDLFRGAIAAAGADLHLQRYSPASLAYLGDAIYELYVRARQLVPPRRMNDYHARVVAQVRADRQAEHLQALLPDLSDRERDWVRRGRNAASIKSRHADPETYRQASGFETLVGYLYLSEPDRLAALLARLDLG